MGRKCDRTWMSLSGEDYRIHYIRMEVGKQLIFENLQIMPPLKGFVSLKEAKLAALNEALYLAKRNYWVMAMDVRTPHGYLRSLQEYTIFAPEATNLFAATLRRKELKATLPKPAPIVPDTKEAELALCVLKWIFIVVAGIIILSVSVFSTLSNRKDASNDVREGSRPAAAASGIQVEKDEEDNEEAPALLPSAGK